MKDYKDNNEKLDCIIMKNMCFYGYHGALPEENKLGQRFYIDVEMKLDLKKAGNSDDLHHTINYAKAYDIIRIEFKDNTFGLIEALAEKISNQLFANFTILDEIMVEVRKPNAPVNGSFDYMAVKIQRSRGED